MLVGLCRWIHPASGHRCVLGLVIICHSDSGGQNLPENFLVPLNLTLRNVLDPMQKWPVRISVLVNSLVSLNWTKWQVLQNNYGGNKKYDQFQQLKSFYKLLDIWV